MTLDPHVEAAFRFWARCGYHREDLLGEAEERNRDLGGDPGALPEVRALVKRELAAQRVAEAGWTEETLNDRLEEAFDELRDAGIVALENAGYSAADAWEDARQAAADREEAGEAVRGAVFFHQQDVERAVEGHGLHLGFGTFDEEVPAVVVAREVREVLAKHGVATEWGGTARHRIRIPPFPWRKRAFTSAPEGP